MNQKIITIFAIMVATWFLLNFDNQSSYPSKVPLPPEENIGGLAIYDRTANSADWYELQGQEYINGWVYTSSGTRLISSDGSFGSSGYLDLSSKSLYVKSISSPSLWLLNRNGNWAYFNSENIFHLEGGYNNGRSWVSLNGDYRLENGWVYLYNNFIQERKELPLKHIIVEEAGWSKPNNYTIISGEIIVEDDSWDKLDLINDSKLYLKFEQDTNMEVLTNLFVKNGTQITYDENTGEAIYNGWIKSDLSHIYPIQDTNIGVGIPNKWAYFKDVKLNRMIKINSTPPHLLLVVNRTTEDDLTTLNVNTDTKEVTQEDKEDYTIINTEFYNDGRFIAP